MCKYFPSQVIYTETFYLAAVSPSKYNSIDRQTIIRRGRGAGKEVILTWSAALFFVASCSVEQWCATIGTCYAVHAWNAPRYIAVRSHVPRAVHRVQSRGLLREPRKFKASQEFCILTIRLGGAAVPREPRFEEPWRACSCKRRVSFGRRPLTADNDRWNDLISRCGDYFCLNLCWRYERLETTCWNWSIIRRLASTISIKILEYVSKNFLRINIMVGFNFCRRVYE